MTKPLKPFEPLLAVKAPDLDTLQYPLFISPKLDGIRCIIRNGQAVSRKLKRIPNRHIQAALCGLPDGLDGELMVLGDDDFLGFNAVQSAVMSYDGEPRFVFFVFDWFTESSRQQGFDERLKMLRDWRERFPNNEHVVLLDQVVCKTPDDAAAAEASYIEQGFEGAMLRKTDGIYKCGRSTPKQEILLKMKRFHDEEATVLGLEEMMHNANEKERDNLGKAKRSTHKANMEPMGTLGKFHLRFDDGAEFRCGGGPGLTHELRQQYWDQREQLVGKRVTIKHQPDPGGRQEGQAPRIPQFLGFRKDI